MKNSYSIPIRQMLLKTMFKRAMVYLSIALLEIALLTPVYMLAYKGTRNSEREYIENDVTSNLRTFSGNMEAIERYVYALMHEDAITYLAHIPDKEGLHASKIRELQGEITRSTILHSACLDDLIVQFKNSSYMIASGYIVRRGSYYGSAIAYEHYDRIAYENLLFSKQERIIPMQRVETESVRGKTAMTFNYYSQTSSIGKYAISVVVCEDTLINELVPEAIAEHGFFRLLTADGSELFSMGEQTDKMDVFDEIADVNGVFRVAYGVDTCVYVENMHSVQLLIGVYCVLALSIALLYSIALAAQSMHTFQTVAAMLEETHAEGMDDGFSAKNMNDFVNEMLKKQIVRADEMEASLKLAQKRYKDEMVFSLMRGSYRAEESDLKILEESSAFRDAYLVMEMCMLDDDTTAISMKEEAVKRAEALFEKHMPTLYVVSTLPFIAVMPFQANSYALIQAVCAEITKQIVPVRMAVSSPHKGVENLAAAYAQARMVRRSKHLFLLEENDVMRYDALSAQMGDGEMIALDIGNTFARLIAEGRREDVERRLQDMNRHFERLALENPQRLSASYYNVVGVFESFYRSLHIDAVVREYDPETPIAEIESYLREVALELSARMAEQREKIEPHDGIVDYIDEHFADSGMSLGLLAKEFDLSEAYISRIIKRCTGMNYTDYLEKLRMKKAEELLFTTQISIGDISAQLGYDNQNTFFKAFKRFYQISPGAYRESHLLDKARS